MDDDLEEARGIANGIIISLVIWIWLIVIMEILCQP